MKSKILFPLFLLLLPFLFFLSSRPSLAQSSPVNIYFFWAKGCPHCTREKEFLKSIENKYPEVKIQSFEISGNPQNTKLLQKVGQELKADISSIPFTVVGEHYFVGFYTAETTGKTIEDAVTCALETSCPDIVGRLITPITPQPPPQKQKTIPETLKLPILGEVQTKNLSLPTLTFFIALLDGFNPCAMWALLFLISLLLGMKNKKRMLILGTAFIAASAFVYLLFMATWLNLLLFLGFILWVRVFIGAVALGAGSYNIKDYITNPAGVCKVSKGKKRQKLLEKLKKFTEKKHFLIALIGIIILAFAVNLVELVCSAGLPAIYTQILALSHLPIWQYYLYLLFYIFIFMLDDLLVFFAAMTTLRAVGPEGKYARYSRLVGGILMLLIGILLLFKPELLMFS
jgi:thiol-disulfide isomerase/thioredoxin